MAHSLSAKKRVRQNLQHRARNRWHKQRFRADIRDFRQSVLHGTVDEVEERFRGLCKMLDQVAAKGTIHKNTVSRYKSRFATRLNAKKTQAT